MDPIELMTSPRGRLSRLPYFIAGLVLSVAVFLLAGGVMVLSVGALFTGMAAFGLFGMLMIFAVILGAGYCSVVLMIKRLHDMGLPGWHSAWIMLLFAIAQFGDPDDPSILAALASLGALGATLWLLFRRGEPYANQYGPAPS
jgi:uncharacterized membrane protein YhaH (DUF805 family)